MYHKLQALSIGKTKTIWSSEDDKVIIKFLDNVDTKGYDFTEKVSGNGAYRLDIAIAMFQVLSSAGVDHHFLERLSETEMLAHRVQMFPCEIVVRNIAEGSIVKNYLFNPGERLKSPIVNIYLKYGYLDPLLDQNLFDALEIGEHEDWQQLQELALQVNDILINYFYSNRIELIDFKIECGRTSSGKLVVADEISPDCFRLRRMDNHQRIDKDLFRHKGESLSIVLKNIKQALNIQ